MSTQAPVDPQARRVLRWGWWLYALLPVAFVPASLLGGWLLSLQGYDGTEPDLPTSAALLAGLPAVLVLVSPMVASAWCGRRAETLGDPRGRALWLVSALVVVLLVGLNLVQVVVRAVTGG